MIKVKRLRGDVFTVNAELIETVEETPDTVITLTTGHKLIVQDTMNEIIEKVIDYKRRTHQTSAPPENILD
jgi:flagellar protein FlbD